MESENLVLRPIFVWQPGPLPALIRCFSRSFYNHVALWDEEGYIWDLDAPGPRKFLPKDRPRFRFEALENPAVSVDRKSFEESFYRLRYSFGHNLGTIVHTLSRGRFQSGFFHRAERTNCVGYVVRTLGLPKQCENFTPGKLLIFLGDS